MTTQVTNTTTNGALNVYLLQQNASNEWQQIGVGQASSSGLVDIEARPISTGQMRIKYVGGSVGSQFGISSIKQQRIDVYQGSQIVTICSKDDDFNGDYRYGFNGQEKDNEMKGEGNSINYKARIQDTRLGRFLSVDPLTKSYPMLTPYQFASNTPIQAIDLDGLEAYYTVDGRLIGKWGKSPVVKIVENKKVIAEMNAVSIGPWDLTKFPAKDPRIHQEDHENKSWDLSKNSHQIFDNKDKTAAEWAKTNGEKSIKNNKEMYSAIYALNIGGTTYYNSTPALTGNAADVSMEQGAKTANWLLVNGISPNNVCGDIHSHGGDDPNYFGNEFSGPDKNGVHENGSYNFAGHGKNKFMNDNKFVNYLFTTNRQLKKYDHATKKESDVPKQ
jgi:RHS repeat-associated protein